MPFPSSREADVRLVSNTEPLTQEEVRDLFPWVRQISEAGMRRLQSELALQNIQAVQQFERSSTRLTIALVVLTVVLVALTAAITYFTILLAQMPKS